MKINVVFFLVASAFLQAQEETMLRIEGNKACDCIEKIDYFGVKKSIINEKIRKCISDRVIPYMSGAGIMNSVGKKSDTISVNVSPESQQYKSAYQKIENYLMEDKICPQIKNIVAQSDDVSELTISKNEKAKKLYDIAVDKTENENYEEAIKNYKSAVKEDPKFFMAWDNLGVCYRKIGEYDKAIEAYQKSLAINPKGKLPLQNLPVAYSYKNDFKNAINAYESLKKIYPNDPESYYGIGLLYLRDEILDWEKSLDYMCKAYNIYSDTNSPYRSDAEKIIILIYQEFKTKNKLEIFNKILSENKIDQVE